MAFFMFVKIFCIYSLYLELKLYKSHALIPSPKEKKNGIKITIIVFSFTSRRLKFYESYCKRDLSDFQLLYGPLCLKSVIL